MTKGKKAYSIVTMILAAIAVTIHLIAAGLFLELKITGAEGAEKGLGLVFLGIFWFIAGGVSTAASVITDIVLFTIKKRVAAIILAVVLSVTLLTFLLWFVMAKGWF